MLPVQIGKFENRRAYKIRSGPNCKGSNTVAIVAVRSFSNVIGIDPLSDLVWIFHYIHIMEYSRPILAILQRFIDTHGTSL